MFSDITDLWRQDETLRHLAFHDALTELLNWFLLMERLSHEIATAQRQRFALVVLFLDLGGDEFVIALNNPSSQDEVAPIARRVVESLLSRFSCRATGTRSAAPSALPYSPMTH